MGYSVEDPMLVVILLSSLNGCEQYAPIMASVNTVDEEVATWKYVGRLL